MKKYWERIALKIDARTLRERTIIFATVALILIVFVNTVILGPQYEKQRQLSQRLKQDQAKIAEIQADIQKMTVARTADPDEENRKRLHALKQQLSQMNDSLRDVQKGLVSPDKMAELLEGMLKRNAGLRLVSLKTLPATGLNELSGVEAVQKNTQSAEASAKDKTENRQPGEAIYKHGVEITVKGSYPQIMNYLADLEAMPWQLFWSKARFSVDEYPVTRLTLTLYTLSLDKRWLSI